VQKTEREREFVEQLTVNFVIYSSDGYYNKIIMHLVHWIILRDLHETSIKLTHRYVSYFYNSAEIFAVLLIVESAESTESSESATIRHTN